MVAAVKTRLLTIDKPVLWQMLANQPVMALNLLHVLSQRIRENNVVLLSSIELQRAYRSKPELRTLIFFLEFQNRPVRSPFGTRRNGSG